MFRYKSLKSCPLVTRNKITKFSYRNWPDVALYNLLGQNITYYSVKIRNFAHVSTYFYTLNNMIKVKITVPDHIAEYIFGKFYDPDVGAVRFPSSLDLYVAIYDYAERRPVSCPVDTGNLEFCLPDRREANVAGGKNPESYNYFSATSQKKLGDKMRVMMLAELHDLMDENKHIHGIQFKDTIYRFVRRYCIESITEDALFKDYQRWRYKQHRRKQKREYNSKKRHKN